MPDTCQSTGAKWCYCRRPISTPMRYLWTDSLQSSAVPVDQTIEQTMNRDSKTKVGIVGISFNRGAVQRWILTAHDRAKVLQTCREMADMYDAASKHHKDASVPRTKKDENGVHKAMHTIESWVNPFKSSEHDWATCQHCIGSESNRQHNRRPTHCRDEGQCCLRQFCGEETEVK